ncbi:hypothetical protein BU16DRAFT_134992 [Lophium mytilinum]|uniref:Uncharacterized protein n=1 Tax=Lophium mytilinum TaxID=390894 RepID=A0A6A6QEH1_9PEZI|nr:hypothetical protein BU16DRAFT_134992 [Lophium mytilinum]
MLRLLGTSRGLRRASTATLVLRLQLLELLEVLPVLVVLGVLVVAVFAVLFGLFGLVVLLTRIRALLEGGGRRRVVAVRPIMGIPDGEAVMWRPWTRGRGRGGGGGGDCARGDHGGRRRGVLGGGGGGSDGYKAEEGKVDHFGWWAGGCLGELGRGELR